MFITRSSGSISYAKPLLLTYLYLFIYLFMFNVYMRPYGYDRRPIIILAMVRSPKHKHTRKITNK